MEGLLLPEWDETCPYVLEVLAVLARHHCEGSPQLWIASKEAIKALVAEGIAPSPAQAAVLVNRLIDSGQVVVVNQTDKDDLPRLVYSLKRGPEKEKPLLSEKQQLEVHLSITDVHPAEVARQLALIEHRMFAHINIGALAENANDRPRELQVWIGFSNRLSQWAARVIMQSCVEGNPIKMLKFVVAIANECRKINAYSSMAAIGLAFSSHEVSRLKQLWEWSSRKVRKTAAAVSSLSSPANNFEALREILKKPSLPCVPFFPIFLKDLTLIQLGNVADAVEELQAPQIAALESMQKCPYSFPPVYRLRKKLLEVSGIEGEEACMLSDQAMIELASEEMSERLEKRAKKTLGMRIRSSLPDLDKDIAAPKVTRTRSKSAEEQLELELAVERERKRSRSYDPKKKEKTPEVMVRKTKTKRKKRKKLGKSRTKTAQTWVDSMAVQAALYLDEAREVGDYTVEKAFAELHYAIQRCRFELGQVDGWETEASDAHEDFVARKTRSSGEACERRIRDEDDEDDEEEDGDGEDEEADFRVEVGGVVMPGLSFSSALSDGASEGMPTVRDFLSGEWELE